MKSYPTYNYSEEDTKNQLARFVRLDNPNSYPFDSYHAHEYNEIMVFIKGGGIHNINFRSHHINDYSLHLLAAHDVHWLERSMRSHGFAIVYKEQFLQKLQFVSPDIDFAGQFAHSRVINLDTDNNDQDFRNIFQELLNSESHDIYMFQLIGAFLTKIATLKKVENPPAKKTYNPLISRIATLIDTHYKSHFSLDDYAQELNISPRTLQNQVRKASGKSLHALQQERILREAKRLLCISEMNISEIAFELGFKATAHFTNWFKTQVHCAPSEYRNPH